MKVHQHVHVSMLANGVLKETPVDTSGLATAQDVAALPDPRGCLPQGPMGKLNLGWKP